MSTAKRAGRIEYLRTLIADGSGAHDGERETARRMLARLLAKQKEETAGAAFRREFGGAYARWYGDKYDRTHGLTLTEIATLIREDIKLAQKIGRKLAVPGEVAVVDPIGTAPKEIKYSVRTQYYSGGGSIKIFVRNIPQEWGWVTETDQWGYEREVPTPALKALAKELKAISNAYNYDGSDITTDYFDKRFYGFVMSEGGLSLA